MNSSNSNVERALELKKTNGDDSTDDAVSEESGEVGAVEKVSCGRGDKMNSSNSNVEGALELKKTKGDGSTDNTVSKESGEVGAVEKVSRGRGDKMDPSKQHDEFSNGPATHEIEELTNEQQTGNPFANILEQMGPVSEEYGKLVEKMDSSISNEEAIHVLKKTDIADSEISDGGGIVQKESGGLGNKMNPSNQPDKIANVNELKEVTNEQPANNPVAFSSEQLEIIQMDLSDEEDDGNEPATDAEKVEQMEVFLKEFQTLVGKMKTMVHHAGRAIGEVDQESANVGPANNAIVNSRQENTFMKDFCALAGQGNDAMLSPLIATDTEGSSMSRSVTPAHIKPILSQPTDSVTWPPLQLAQLSDPCDYMWVGSRMESPPPSPSPLPPPPENVAPKPQNPLPHGYDLAMISRLFPIPGLDKPKPDHNPIAVVLKVLKELGKKPGNEIHKKQHDVLDKAIMLGKLTPEQALKLKLHFDKNKDWDKFDGKALFEELGDLETFYRPDKDGHASSPRCPM